MTKIRSRTIQKSRIFFQAFFLVIFLIGFFLPAISDNLVEVFFWFDPLLLLMNFIAVKKIFYILLFSLIPLLLTLIFGRFFCGWVCPFGTINQFFTWLFRKSNRKRPGPGKAALNLKYLILIGLIVSGILGVHIWGWLDPFSLLTRSLSTLTSSVDYLAQKTSIVQKGESVISDYQHVSVFPYLIAGLFFLFIGLNYYSKRFFCNVLCPLGAIYGLVARFGLRTLSTNDSCKTCVLCSKNCNYNSELDKDFSASECLVCYNCSTVCPKTAVETSFTISKREKTKKLDLGRRKVIGSVVSGIITAPLLKTTIDRVSKKRLFIRPPGAVTESEFIENCMRCGQCVQSCPTSFIQPAFTEAGLEGLWTPIVNAKAGYCLFECTECTEVCPSEALKPLSLNEKKTFKIGTAIVDKNLCYTYSDGFTCTVCYDKCPTKEKAIKQREIEIWSFTGRLTKIKQIYIDPDLCTGCGICEYVCPRTDAPGIYITPADEQREKVTGIV